MTMIGDLSRAPLSRASSTPLLAPNRRDDHDVFDEIATEIAGRQPLDATLTALAGVTTAADQVLYATGADAFATTALTAFGRSLIDDADQAAARATLGAAASGANADITSLSALTYALLGTATAVTVRTNASAVTPTLQVDGTSAAGSSMLLSRFVISANGPALYLYHVRSATVGGAGIAANGDVEGTISFACNDGVQAVEGVTLKAVVAGTPGVDSMPSDFVISTNPGGTTAVAETARFRGSDKAFLVASGVVIDGSRLVYLRSYTYATLPTPSTCAQSMAWCSDLGGGPGPVISNGTVWKRMDQSGFTAVATDADFTWSPMTSAPTVQHTGTLTAARTVTLSTTGAYAGLRCRVVRTGAGAFGLSLGGLATLYRYDEAVVEYDGSAWQLVSVDRVLAQQTLDLFGVAANTTVSIPAGYAINRITYANTTANAVTGGVKIGTTSGGTDVVAAQAIGANALGTVRDSALLLDIFSRSSSQTLYVQAVTDWNSASIDLHFDLERIF